MYAVKTRDKLRELVKQAAQQPDDEALLRYSDLAEEAWLDAMIVVGVAYPNGSGFSVRGEVFSDPYHPTWERVREEWAILLAGR